MPTLQPRPSRRLSTLACAFVAAAALASTVPTATAQSATAPHWGFYKWDGGTQTADVRAFWLFDRTGNQAASDTIRAVVTAWNSYHNSHPELPIIGLYRDDANAGRCFVNRTPGYSVASACMMPQDIHGVKAIAARNADSSGHLLGAAFAIAEDLDADERLTLVCHAFGHVMGLDDSENEESCMFPASAPEEVRWYDQADAEAILSLYEHNENAPATTTTSAPATTTTAAPATTTTAVPATTTTVAPTTTTVAPTTTTSSTILDCSGLPPLPVGCP